MQKIWIKSVLDGYDEREVTVFQDTILELCSLIDINIKSLLYKTSENLNDSTSSSKCCDASALA